ncbi:chitin-binding type-2 domain-containing protein [Trichonephila inaurata madagascariensis]|uniref:Chitin-binding type-2 domain-containing protein n=1 Tax=Trichonephila inaurata madagascariensis TaxID=2747483 RepID=A0A8X6YA66_9ARAC|nr:chitin-binding type-2 domain-containing protein [Trichonephila inaurata madagascariensis]
MVKTMTFVIITFYTLLNRIQEGKMISITWIFLTIFVILGAATSNNLETKLIRTKRWEGNGDMNTGDMSNMFRGTAGVDYPDLKTIPTTAFKCSDQEYEGGLYADVETRCQVYHVCHDGRKDSFMCGRGTIFNQQILACDYWYSTECETAPSYYYLNAQIGGSDTSWVPPQGNSQYNPQPYNQGTGYQPYNPNGNGGASDSTGETAGNGQQDGQKPCCCLKNNYQAPWNFPSNLVNQNRKK